jgi:hypothetical protein
MQCPCHGSRYNIDGTLRRGPAGFPLRQFTTRFDGVDSLTIEVPDVSFSLDALRVQSTAGRIRLDFIGFEQIEYEIRARANSGDVWTAPVPFSLTPDGPLDQTMIAGEAALASVYIECASGSGMFGVAMRVKQV